MIQRFRYSVLLFMLSVASLASEAAPQSVTSPQLDSASASGPSLLLSISPDGRHVLFLSSARNLVPNDDLGASLNLYRYDRESGQVVLVSPSVLRSTTAGGANADIAAASASTNGLLAFATSASNLIPADTNGWEDVFLRDLNSHTTVLVTRTLNGGVSSSSGLLTNQPLCGNPLISRDGRFVAFESRAADLVALSDANNASDIFLYDVQSSSTRAVSVSTNNTATANSASRLGAITPDGRKIVFLSTASNLVVNGPTNRNEEVYLHDTETGETTWLSRGLSVSYPGAPAPSLTYRCFFPALSADGDSVVFKAVAPNAPTAAVFLCRPGLCSVLTTAADIRSPPQISTDGNSVTYDANGQIYRNSDLVSTNMAAFTVAHSPAMTPDGSKLAFLVSLTNTPAHVFFRDMSQPSIVQITAGGTRDFANLALVPDGSYVAFDTGDSSLVARDFNGASDVFLRNLDSGTTVLVSGAHAGLRPRTARNLSLINKFSLSADGQKVVFTTFDSDLEAGDTNGWPDVFVRHHGTGQTLSISDSNGVFEPNISGLDPAISADGRYVTFARRGWNEVHLIRADLQTGSHEVVVSNVVAGSTLGPRNLFTPLGGNGRLVVYFDRARTRLRDMTSGTNRSLSAIDTSPGAVPATPLLSPDETAVLFVEGDGQLTLHELGTATNVPIGAAQYGYRFSANSRYVVYPGFRYDRLTRSNLSVCTSCENLTISGDGRLVAYERISGTSRAIELRDLEANRATLVSQNAYGANGNGRSTTPVLSHDGAYLVFVSRASDLVLNDNNNAADIFVYDVRLKKLVRIAGQLPDASPGAGPASNPVLGPDGRTLAFQSFSARMVPNDFDHQSDIFILRLGAGDSDDDALADDWEMAYFGNLTQNASDDIDSDGHTNAQEYMAGTDPTNQNSVLRVIAVMSSSTGEVQLFWNAVPGKRYRVEYKNTLTDPDWSSLPGLYISGTATDPNTFSSSKFYRVVAVD